MEIVHYPHPALRWKSKPITRINDRVREVVAEMFALMYEAKGIGLAANQVALPWRLFIINPTGDPNEKDQEFVFINPEISKRKGSEEGEEGCLSVPKLYGQVNRPNQVVITAYDLSGQEFEMELDELPGRVVQHEADHLDGVMFFDHMSDDARSELDVQIQDFEYLFRKGQESGKIPSDGQIRKDLEALERELDGE